MARLVSQSMPVMRAFARDAQQAVHLVIYDRNVLVVVAQVDSPGYWNVSIRVGARIQLTNTGSGHVFLAYASAEERPFMLEDPVTRARETLTSDIAARLEQVQGARLRDACAACRWRAWSISRCRSSMPSEMSSPR